MEGKRFKFLLLFFLFIVFILLAEGVYYWRSTKKSPTPELTQPYLGEMVATGRVEVFLSPGENKVGYFVPGQKFTSTGDQEGSWVQVIDADGYELWIEKNGDYQPASQ
ncbi:hypothetical protein COU95_01220 [Candidatus Shapirobacteria bacterium CG10_big_fil_rev_8_21_14_0_10_40_9]|uniref:SH3b domain-containing protein n=1 Tax=Candidatus Shapirobacteria bacterium CG10_big_fil_rev_8_21_14_0_10_40_9 TaxID=1974888 RepID=A0A2M8L402_9BACT|nr:MAG: hypothetical protein COU95_01220 [Candidatus Shapirobacteria bacterium CG10_big_fil_rev_8_21_14_0_10_40_9]